LAKKELFLSLDQARDPTDEANVLFVYPLTEIGKRQTLKWWGFLGPVRQVKVGKSWKKSGNFVPLLNEERSFDDQRAGFVALLEAGWRTGTLDERQRRQRVRSPLPLPRQQGGYVRKTNILGK
jgi:hypothetical protein